MSSSRFSDNPEARRILKKLRAGEGNLFVTGEAGTGKSTLLREYLDSEHGRKRHAAVVAPTGLAALRVSGQTIHSFFRIEPRRYAPEELAKVAVPEPVRDKLMRLNLLVIDEISMVRADLFCLLETILRRYGPLPTQPWGGVQVVCFGDFLQLPPVVTRDDAALFDGTAEDHGGWLSPFAFDTDAWKAGAFAKVTLVRNYRQAEDESAYRALLARVRSGNLQDEDRAFLNARAGVPADWQDALRLCPTNSQAEGRNRAELDRLPGESVVVEASESLYDRNGRRVDTAESAREEQYPVPPRLELKVGARVILCQNDLDTGHVNGQVGRVESIEAPRAGVSTEYKVLVRFDETGRVVPVKVGTWTEWRFDWDKKQRQWTKWLYREYRQLPLRLAWALTIHKAQGQTVRGRMVIHPGCFAPSQMYVALSRITDSANLRIESRLAPQEVHADSTARAFMASPDTPESMESDGTPTA